MEKIVISKDLGQALLAFTSNDKYRRAINGLYCAADGALVATDGKRLLHVTQEKHGVILAPGVYSIASKGTESKYMLWMHLERIEEQFPDIAQVIPKHALAIKEGEKALKFALLKGRKAQVDPLRLMRALYLTFHVTGKAFDPLLMLDLPADEGFDLYTDGTPAGVLDVRGQGIRALFCPFKTQD
jgi:hypothetical protein